MDWQAFWLTIRLAALVAGLLAFLALPVAYWITYSRWRWKFLAEAVVALPIVLPPTVLGFYVLLALGSRSPLGRWWQGLTGHTLAFTFEGLVIGSILYSLPFAVQPFAAVIRRCGSPPAGCFRNTGRFAGANILPRNCAAVSARTGDRRGSELRPYHGRIWRGADGRRQHSWGYANRFH